MADPRFFKKAGPFTLAQLAEITGAELQDAAAASTVMTDVASLQDAIANQISFLDNKKYADQFRATKAGACFVRPEIAAQAPKGTVCLTHKNPYKAYALCAQAFYPAEKLPAFVAPSAVVDPSAKIGAGCHIGHGAVVGKNVVIGDGCVLGPHAVICDGVEMGRACDMGAGVYITHAIIGNGVRIYPHAVIGRAGFGFAIDPAGFVSVPQLGRVVIGDGVEIGANTTIDRGAGPDTIIGAGTRIDNLVQLGHNVQTGKACIIVAHAGISGSTKLGDFVMMGGQAGAAGHLTIGSGAKIGGQSGVMRDVEAGEELMGTPAIPIKKFMRQAVTLSKLTARKGEKE